MLISYGSQKARCDCSKGQNKTAQNRVPPRDPVGLFQQKAEQTQNQISMVVPRGGIEPDTCIFSAVLYQLSYLGAAPARARTKEERGVYRGSIPPCPECRSGAGN